MPRVVRLHAALSMKTHTKSLKAHAARDAKIRVYDEESDCIRRWGKNRPMSKASARAFAYAAGRVKQAPQMGSREESGMRERYKYRLAMETASALLMRGRYDEAAYAYRDAAGIAPTRHKWIDAMAQFMKLESFTH